VRTLTLIGMGALLLVFFFQCCPSAAPEAPSIEAPSEQTAPPPPQQATEEPTAAPAPPLPPTAEPAGLSADHPVPVNHTLTTASGAAITIHGVSARGEQAKQVTQEWNMFNEPDPGNEYVMIPATVAYEGGPTETLSVSYWQFRVAVGPQIFEHPFLLMEGNELEGEMFEGGSVDGLLVFEVPEGSVGIVVMYSVPLDRTYYFATE
jgi:hypothetical protein